ncbi:hypothetical protein [Stenotrophomonas sp. NPDC078853]|uniref:hypothetical protein n=1 Tax=Stenotrophomonas sp. NPDC078853 TaxID=3364534 RepID=UPI00384A8DB1
MLASVTEQDAGRRAGVVERGAGSRSRAALVAAVALLAAVGGGLSRSGDEAAPVQDFTGVSATPGSAGQRAALSGTQPPQVTRGLSEVHRLWAVKTAADGGDAAAMREIAFTSARCAGMGHGRQGIQHTLDGASANLEMHRPEAAAAYRSAGQRLEAQCEVLSTWSSDLRAFGRLWRDRAAEAGDLTATIRNTLYEAQRDPQVAAELLDRVIASGDAAAIAEMGALLFQMGRGGQSLPGYEGMAFDVFDFYAMQVIACQRGLACGEGSVMLDDICLTGMQCTFADFPALLWHNVEEDGEAHQLEQAMKKMRGLLEG